MASLPGAKNDRLIIIGSFSKTFAMTGWRLGYALAPKPLIEAMIKLQSQSTSNPNSITQYAGVEAMRGPDGSGCDDACRIRAEARTDSCRNPRDSRNYVHCSARRVLHFSGHLGASEYRCAG